MEIAASEAIKSLCKRSKCGSIVVDTGGIIIGRGYNSPPGHYKDDKDVEYRCSCDKNSYHKKVTDKTCCIHAEQRAILNAVYNLGALSGRIWTDWALGVPPGLDKLYFTRVNDNGEILKSGKPYCTICSKMALDCGIKEFVLWHEDGIYSYPTDEYNDLSFQYEE